MIELTQQAIDFVAPEHDRTSCSDTDTGNGYGGWSGKYNPNGSKEIHFPRCTRCYLLNHLEEDTDTLEFKIDASLVWKL